MTQSFLCIVGTVNAKRFATPVSDHIMLSFTTPLGLVYMYTPCYDSRPASWYDRSL